MLTVGKFYPAENGIMVKITRRSFCNGKYKYIDDNGQWYYPNGVSVNDQTANLDAANGVWDLNQTADETIIKLNELLNQKLPIDVPIGTQTVKKGSTIRELALQIEQFYTTTYQITPEQDSILSSCA